MHNFTGFGSEEAICFYFTDCLPQLFGCQKLANIFSGGAQHLLRGACPLLATSLRGLFYEGRYMYLWTSWVCFYIKINRTGNTNIKINNLCENGVEIERNSVKIKNFRIFDRAGCSWKYLSAHNRHVCWQVPLEHSLNYLYIDFQTKAH